MYHVAVVIPARNRPDLLEKCLSSLANQDFSLNECEILICDDGSTEDLRLVTEKFNGAILNLRLLRQQPKGPAAARNMGFRSSNADIFVCVDSDVVCEPGFLKNLINALQTHPEWVAAEATVLPKSESTSVLLDSPENRGGGFPSGASAYRAETLFKVGGFDEKFLLPACEDAELAARLLQLGKYGYVPVAIAYHPVRRVTLRTHWRWRRHWKYEMILAKRYGFLSFPGNPASRFPRLRVALAAVITLPGGRFMEAVKCMKRSPSEGFLACLYALFDVCCGLWALPDIMFSEVPPQKDYLSSQEEDTEIG